MTARRSACRQRLIGAGVPVAWVGLWIEQLPAIDGPSAGDDVHSAEYWERAYQSIMAGFLAGRRPHGA